MKNGGAVVEGSFIASVALKSNMTMDETIAEVKEQLKMIK